MDNWNITKYKLRLVQNFQWLFIYTCKCICINKCYISLMKCIAHKLYDMLSVTIWNVHVFIVISRYNVHLLDMAAKYHQLFTVHPDKSTVVNSTLFSSVQSIKSPTADDLLTGPSKTRSPAMGPWMFDLSRVCCMFITCLQDIDV